MKNDIVIQVDNLRKIYGNLAAVDGVSFEIHAGEIFGMVGPNGAGKTTTVECIEGLRSSPEGSIRVLGLDPQRDERQLRERTGVQLQESSLPDRLKVWEALDLFASFYRRSVDWRPLLEQLGLAEKQDAPFAKLSGGQKQRLHVALALVNDPEVVFLDELTTGLDPQSRRNIWDLIREVRARGATVFLTTHFMEEAERLCDRVAIMDHGKIIALDTPENLVRDLDAESRIVFNVNGNFDPAALEAHDLVTRVEQGGDQITVHGRREGLVGVVVKALEANHVPFENLRTEQPNLEDVFLALTGRKLRD